MDCYYSILIVNSIIIANFVNSAVAIALTKTTSTTTVMLAH